MIQDRSDQPLADDRPVLGPLSKDGIEQSIYRRFHRVTQALPDRVAIDEDGRRITYRELGEEVDRIVEATAAVGGVRGRPVALVLDQGIELIVGILASLKLGCPYVPLDPAAPSVWRDDILSRIRPGVVLATEPVSSDAPCFDPSGPAPRRRDLSNPRYSPEATGCGEVDAAAVAYIYYTSGTSGRPKGVYDSHRNVLHNVWRYTSTLGIGRTDRLTLLQPPGFSGAVSSMFGALLNGATSLPIDLKRFSPREIGEWVNRMGVTIFHSVPSVFRLLTDGGMQFPTVRVVRMEGDQAAPMDVDRFRQCFSGDCVLQNGLGATECGLVRQFFVRHGDFIDGPSFPVGYPVEDMGIEVQDPAGNAAGPGEIGEVLVRSKYLALGYWDDPGGTARRFSAESADGIRTYRTGDIGRMMDDGCLVLLGRVEQLPKVGGHFVDPSRVEHALVAHPSVGAAAVVGEREEAGGVGSGDQRLVAFVVLRLDPGKSNPVLEGDLRAHLRTRLPAGSLPARILVVPEIPTTPAGKRDDLALKSVAALELQSAELTSPQGRPAEGQPTERGPNREAIESMVHGAWVQVLGRSVAREDDFLAIGGDSLAAMRILARLEGRTGIRVSVAELFQLRTISGLAEHITAAS